jgi:3',5'-cyclic AMP phosphodiesterase CpdA
LALLEQLDASNPLDIVLISGDATDAGRAAEWAEFLEALAAHGVRCPGFEELIGPYALSLITGVASL